MPVAGTRDSGRWKASGVVRAAGGGAVATSSSGNLTLESQVIPETAQAGGLPDQGGAPAVATRDRIIRGGISEGPFSAAPRMCLIVGAPRGSFRNAWRPRARAASGCAGTAQTAARACGSCLRTGSASLERAHAASTRDVARIGDGLVGQPQKTEAAAARASCCALSVAACTVCRKNGRSPAR